MNAYPECRSEVLKDTENGSLPITSITVEHVWARLVAENRVCLNSIACSLLSLSQSHFPVDSNSDLIAFPAPMSLPDSGVSQSSSRISIASLLNEAEEAETFINISNK
jgi:hypothetical protein